MILVTGGYGFIGSNLVRHLLDTTLEEIVVMDAMTYAARPEWVMQHKDRYRVKPFLKDIRDPIACKEVIASYKPDYIFHLAAESHVCNSIRGPRDFVETNVLGTFNLLEAMRSEQSKARLVHVSTDEVFGELENDGSSFNRSTPYAPRSPYSATKAGSDHLVRAWVETYGINAVVTNCSNNYGPNQHDEKLIPRAISRIFSGQPMTVHNSGTNVRDWIWVEDHCRGLAMAAVHGQKGGTYLFGGETELQNIEVIEAVHRAVIKVTGQHHDLNLEYTNDRPTDDTRYAIDTSEATVDLGWAPQAHFYDQLEETVRWYFDRLVSGGGTKDGATTQPG